MSIQGVRRAALGVRASCGCGRTGTPWQRAKSWISRSASEPTTPRGPSSYDARRVFTRAILSTLLLALLAACGRTDRDSPSQPEPGVDAACSSCEQTECAAPGKCSLEAACALIECDSATVDEQACLRPACENDADCSDGESCISVTVGSRYDCVEVAGVCHCSSGKGLFPLKLCSPRPPDAPEQEPCGAAYCVSDADCAGDARCVTLSDAERPECHATICSQLDPAEP
jgi:hypothetical protein